MQLWECYIALQEKQFKPDENHIQVVYIQDWVLTYLKQKASAECEAAAS